MTDNNEQMKELQRQLEELKSQQANTRVDNPVTNQQAVMVRQTASGMEQGVAAIAGLLTAGPLGALASWGVIRGLQGKWTPWFVLGIPAAPILGVAQLVLLGAMAGSGTDSNTPAPTSSSLSSNALPAYNQPVNGGTTTLQQKCLALQSAEENLNLARVAELSFQVGFEHNTPMGTSVETDCASVGVSVN